ncbi:hypothetical protein [Streptomyces sp. NPDC002758]
MEYQQRGLEMRDAVGLWLGSDVVEELSLDAKRASGQGDLGLAESLDLAPVVSEQVQHVVGAEGCSDRRHRSCLGYAVSCGENGSTAEGVSDEEGWCLEVGTQVSGGRRAPGRRRLS